MVNIAPDFPIEDSSREPRGIEQDLLSPVFLTRSFPPSNRVSFFLGERLLIVITENVGSPNTGSTSIGMILSSYPSGWALTNLHLAPCPHRTGGDPFRQRWGR